MPRPSCRSGRLVFVFYERRRSARLVFCFFDHTGRQYGDRMKAERHSRDKEQSQIPTSTGGPRTTDWMLLALPPASNPPYRNRPRDDMTNSSFQ